MKKIWPVSILFILIAGYTLYSCKQVKQPPETGIARLLVAETDSFSTIIGDQFLAAAENPRSTGPQLRQLFLKSRLAYKKFEWAAEYFTYDVSRTVNGAPVPEVELDGHVLEPGGLQVIEGYLYPKYDTVKRTELIGQLKLLRSSCNLYKLYFSHIGILNWQVFDAAKLEVFRILALGISGFDAPLSQNSMNEAANALGGLQSAIRFYNEAGKLDTTLAKFNAAIGYLRANRGFNTFNRAVFITGYGNPVGISLTGLQHSLNLPDVKYSRLLRQEAATMFDKNAFDVNAYIPAPGDNVTGKKAALGKKLFSDPILSGPETRSCASCHQPNNAFTDGLVKNTMIGNPAQLVDRNTPTLLNAALQPAQFYDLRAKTLEDQVQDVISNPKEMHGSMKIAAKRLWNNKQYRQLFSDAFPKTGKQEIDSLEIMNAIASYVRSLVALNSRFDEYMRGDKTAMSGEEIAGFNLFMGKAKCGTCHYMPLFNGAFPPIYQTDETEVIGVPASLKYKVVDKDMGRFNISHFAMFKHAFKVPTVRNAARTAPYMHNGVFANLNEVLDFYNQGGGEGEGLKIDHQTLSEDKLHLSGREIKELIAFIGSLNSN